MFDMVVIVVWFLWLVGNLFCFRFYLEIRFVYGWPMFYGPTRLNGTHCTATPVRDAIHSLCMYVSYVRVCRTLMVMNSGLHSNLITNSLLMRFFQRLKGPTNSPPFVLCIA